MVRPVTNQVLHKLSPTANVSAHSSELPATVVDQKNPTEYVVTTADGTAKCSLTVKPPLAGQMRLQAFDHLGGSYYVSDLTQNFATIWRNTGNAIPNGTSVRWSFNAASLTMLQINHL